ncbi:uncharacterized protein RB166_000446 [Leptodactylus fuscus]
MERDRNKMAESLLNLTLEIIYQLTGEDYTVVKKTSSGRCRAPVYEGYGGTLSPIPGPPPHPLIQEEINGQKLLELANKMLELLTGEVPIRCQDIAVYFPMEEWEYLEGHREMYKEVMMEDHQSLTSPGNRHDYIHMDFHYLYVQNEFSPCLCILQVDPGVINAREGVMSGRMTGKYLGPRILKAPQIMPTQLLYKPSQGSKRKIELQSELLHAELRNRMRVANKDLK